MTLETSGRTITAQSAVNSTILPTAAESTSVEHTEAQETKDLADLMVDVLDFVRVSMDAADVVGGEGSEAVQSQDE